MHILCVPTSSWWCWPLFRLRAGPHYKRFSTIFSSPAGKYEALNNANRDLALIISARSLPDVSSTRIQSSSGRRNARPAALIMRAYVLIDLWWLLWFWFYETRGTVAADEESLVTLDPSWPCVPWPPWEPWAPLNITRQTEMTEKYLNNKKAITIANSTSHAKVHSAVNSTANSWERKRLSSADNILPKTNKEINITPLDNHYVYLLLLTGAPDTPRSPFAPEGPGGPWEQDE